MTENHKRCDWCGNDKLYIKYHDEEWGVPLKDDEKLFELLCLECAQAGLSWITILRKRDNFRAAFDNFNPQKIALYDKTKIFELLNNAGIIRNRLKIESIIGNAKIYLDVKSKIGSFSDYIWQFTEGKTIVSNFTEITQIPARTNISDKMSKKLKSDGFKFVGSTICYAFMQSCGMVNDHLTSCFRFNQITNLPAK